MSLIVPMSRIYTIALMRSVTRQSGGGKSKKRRLFGGVKKGWGKDRHHGDTCIDALLTLRDENENSFTESSEPFVVRKSRFNTKDEKKIT
ncbi:hypothetical protein Leryth_017591 [Lithospermum erythrorhizon]|nr:hypothetical protein Leryth_017591 [Lithospermum erythrorhizon]